VVKCLSTCLADLQRAGWAPDSLAVTHASCCHYPFKAGSAVNSQPHRQGAVAPAHLQGTVTHSHWKGAALPRGGTHRAVELLAQGG
jgi:hypothetical protein